MIPIIMIFFITYSNSLSLQMNVVQTFFQQDSNAPLKSLELEDQVQKQVTYVHAALFTNGMSFNLPLKINGYRYNLTIDTGSSDFVVKGAKLPGGPSLKLNPNSDGRIKHFLNYVSAYLSAFEYDVQVIMSSNIFKTSLLVAYSGVGFQKTEGLIGLSVPQSAKKRPTFLQTLILKNITTKYAFGLNLNLLQKDRSIISFGIPDLSYVDGQFQEYPMSNTKPISLYFQSLQIGEGAQIDLSNIVTLLDTGSTTISFSSQYKDIVLSSFLVGSNECEYYVYKPLPIFWVIICKVYDFQDLPDINIQLAGKTFTIPKQYYLRLCTKNDDPEEQLENYYCLTYIKVDITKKNRVSFGCPFFSRYYTYFDIEQFKVGIGKNRENITIQYIISISRRKFDSKIYGRLRQQNIVQYVGTQKQQQKDLEGSSQQESQQDDLQSQSQTNQQSNQSIQQDDQSEVNETSTQNYQLDTNEQIDPQQNENLSIFDYQQTNYDQNNDEASQEDQQKSNLNAE